MPTRGALLQCALCAAKRVLTAGVSLSVVAVSPVQGEGTCQTGTSHPYVKCPAMLEPSSTTVVLFPKSTKYMVRWCRLRVAASSAPGAVPGIAITQSLPHARHRAPTALHCATLATRLLQIFQYCFDAPVSCLTDPHPYGVYGPTFPGQVRPGAGFAIHCTGALPLCRSPIDPVCGCDVPR